jgi:hypothetical protein
MLVNRINPVKLNGFVQPDQLGRVVSTRLDLQFLRKLLKYVHFSTFMLFQIGKFDHFQLIK